MDAQIRTNNKDGVHITLHESYGDITFDIKVESYGLIIVAQEFNKHHAAKETMLALTTESANRLSLGTTS